MSRSRKPSRTTSAIRRAEKEARIAEQRQNHARNVSRKNALDLVAVGRITVDGVAIGPKIVGYK